MENNQSELPVILPNLSKDSQGNVRNFPRNKTLEKAIDNNDLSVIQDFLISESKFDGIKSLSKYYKSKLLPLLLEFLDQPLRIEAMDCIYDILNDVKNVEVFSKVLIQRSVDFNKLVYLKGKIDYLKYLEKATVEDKIENEYEEA